LFKINDKEKGDKMKFKKCVLVGLICFLMLNVVGCRIAPSKTTEDKVSDNSTSSQVNTNLKDEEKVNVANFPINQVIQTKYPSGEITFHEITYNPLNKGLYLKFDFKNLETEPTAGRNFVNNTVFQNGIEIANNDGVSMVGTEPIKDNNDTFVSCNENATKKVQQGYEIKDCEMKYSLEPVDNSPIEVDFDSVPYKVILNIQ
jgi:hypothetical protein